jgi:hypothetical protein
VKNSAIKIRRKIPKIKLSFIAQNLCYNLACKNCSRRICFYV